jgi:hypothetical protein
MGNWSTKRPLKLKKCLETEQGSIEIAISALPRDWFNLAKSQAQAEIMGELLDKAFRSGKVKKPLRKDSVGSAKRALRYRRKLRTRNGNIRIGLSTSLKGWLILSCLNHESFSLVIQDFINEAFTRIEVRSFFRNLPRGVHKDRDKFVERMRRLATYTYHLLRGLMKNPSGEMKEFAENLIKEFEKKPRSQGVAPEKALAHRVTAFIMEEIFRKERRKHGLVRWTDDPDNFRKTYINVERLRSRFYKSRLEKLSINFKEITQLPFGKDPLAAFRVWFSDILDEAWSQYLLK